MKLGKVEVAAKEAAIADVVRLARDKCCVWLKKKVVG